MPVLNSSLNKALFFLLLIWLIVQFALLLFFGIHTDLEAEKYTHAAKYLLEHGSFPEKKYAFYALTPLLIAASLKCGLGYAGAVAGQLLLNALSTYLFFQIVYKLTQSAKAALIASAILVTFFPYQAWNVYLYTESLFFSALLIFFYFLVRHSAAHSDKSKWSVCMGITFLAVLAARPFGILFIPGLVLYFILRLPKKYFVVSILACLAGTAFMYYALNRTFSGSGDWDAMISNTGGNIICNLPDSRYIQPLTLLGHGNPVDQLIYYVVHNPKHYVQLSAERLWSFFVWTRSYYGKAHNTYLIVSMLLVYGLMLSGFKNFYKNTTRPLGTFVTASLCVYTFAITLQCDDYHSRFVQAILPFFILIGAFGIPKIALKLTGKKQP